ncbi:APC family permease [Rickettsia endosymbiont of Halotydeus destructor]|uniref:APC family permease n=1 Tax=Rickettsia endosymbiont of Halotydeus destructor TaxID=2996754 RepID=UPI003BAFA093
MLKKLGFWSVFALVTGSQIGTGIFILPASLAPFGIYSVWGWILSSCGAISIALLFATLCARFPKTGGPHVYVQEAFGNFAAFFIGWTYWIISFVSSGAVIISAIGYLTPLIGEQTNLVYLFLEISLLIAIAALNLKGPELAGRAEFWLTILKFIPLLIVAICALCRFDVNNFVIDKKVNNLSMAELMGRVTLLTFWGFIGIECATTSAGAVINPSKTIPRAIVLGTVCVAALYLINSIGIMGLIPGAQLMYSKAPYVDAARLLFGGSWHLLISLIASVICIGTLNAWVLTSGQIALGLAEDGLMPRLFAKKNINDAPMWGLIISCAGIVPLLIFTANESFSEQITQIMDMSVIAFLFVYLICGIAFLKILFNSKEKFAYYYPLIGILSIIFCGWIIYETPVKTLIIASMFTFSGLPVYFFWYQKKKYH